MKQFESYLDRMKSDLFSSVLKSDQMKLMQNVQNRLGHKRYYPYYHATVGASDVSNNNVIIDPPPIYPDNEDTEIENIFNENNSNTEFTISSQTNNNWVLRVFNFSENVFSGNISHQGQNVWIGVLKDSSLSEGLHTLSIQDFENLSKFGILKDSMSEKIMKNNLFTRIYDIGISNILFLKLSQNNQSIILSIGNSNYKSRNIRLDNGFYKIFVAVKYSTFSFSKILPALILKSDLNVNTELDIDATECNVLFTSENFIELGEKSYLLQILNQYDKENIRVYFLHSNKETSSTFSYLNYTNEFPTDFVIKLSQQYQSQVICNSLINVDDTLTDLLENNIFFHYNPQSATTGTPFVFIGTDQDQYSSIYFDENVNTFTSYKIIIQVTSGLVRFKSVSVNNIWQETIRNTFTSNTNVLSSISSVGDTTKNRFNRVDNSPNSTYYFPSTFIGDFSTVKYIFEYFIENDDVFLGFLFQQNSSVVATSFYEPNEFIRFNLKTGSISINGIQSNVQIQSGIRIFYASFKNVSEGTIVNIGTNGQNANQNILLAGQNYVNIRPFITAQNLSSNHLITLHKISLTGLTGLIDETPSSIADTFPEPSASPYYSIAEILNDYDESLNHEFTISSTSNTEWSFYTCLDYRSSSFDPLAVAADIEIGIYDPSKLLKWNIGVYWGESLADNFTIAHKVANIDDFNRAWRGYGFDGIKQYYATTAGVTNTLVKNTIPDDHYITDKVYLEAILNHGLPSYGIDVNALVIGVGKDNLRMIKKMENGIGDHPIFLFAVKNGYMKIKQKNLSNFKFKYIDYDREIWLNGNHEILYTSFIKEAQFSSSLFIEDMSGDFGSVKNRFSLAVYPFDDAIYPSNLTDPSLNSRPKFSAVYTGYSFRYDRSLLAFYKDENRIIKMINDDGLIFHKPELQIVNGVVVPIVDTISDKGWGNYPSNDNFYGIKRFSANNFQNGKVMYIGQNESERYSVRMGNNDYPYYAFILQGSMPINTYKRIFFRDYNTISNINLYSFKYTFSAITLFTETPYLESFKDTDTVLWNGTISFKRAFFKSHTNTNQVTFLGEFLPNRPLPFTLSFKYFILNNTNDVFFIMTNGQGYNNQYYTDVALDIDYLIKYNLRTGECHLPGSMTPFFTIPVNTQDFHFYIRIAKPSGSFITLSIGNQYNSFSLNQHSYSNSEYDRLRPAIVAKNVSNPLIIITAPYKI